MEAQKLNSKDDSKVNTPRDRRHWHAHEKLDIIKKYDAKELSPARGKEGYVIDPKSGQPISIINTIEKWRDSFRAFGVLPKATKTYTTRSESVHPIKITKPQDIPNDVNTVQSLLLKALIENESLKNENFSLKEVIALLRENANLKKTRGSSQRMQASL